MSLFWVEVSYQKRTDLLLQINLGLRVRRMSLRKGFCSNGGVPLDVSFCDCMFV